MFVGGSNTNLDSGALNPGLPLAGIVKPVKSTNMHWMEIVWFVQNQDLKTEIIASSLFIILIVKTYSFLKLFTHFHAG